MVLASLVFIANVIWQSRLLRPIADDYCLAAAAGNGVLESTFYYFNTWSGSLVPTVFSVALVGLPAVNLKLSLAAAIPFLLTSAVVGLTVTFIASQSFNLNKNSKLHFFLIAGPIFTTLWWSYWWVPGMVGEARNLEFGITHWQNLNSAWVMPTMLFLGIYIYLHYKEINLLPKFIALALLGILVGLSGPRFAFAFILILVFLFFFYFYNKNNIRFDNIFLLYIVLIFALIDLHSPGTQTRIQQIEGFRQLEQITIPSLFAWTFPTVIFDWWSGFFNFGSLTVFLIAASLGYFFNKSYKNLDKKIMFDISYGLLIFSLLLTFSNRIAQAFAYSAWWHLVAPHSVIFLFVASFGFYIGLEYVSSPFNKLNSFAPIILVLVYLLNFSASINMIGTMQERFPRWAAGPAPVAGMADINEGWVKACWDDLRTKRVDLPRR